MTVFLPATQGHAAESFAVRTASFVLWFVIGGVLVLGPLELSGRLDHIDPPVQEWTTLLHPRVHLPSLQLTSGCWESNRSNPACDTDGFTCVDDLCATLIAPHSGGGGGGGSGGGEQTACVNTGFACHGSVEICQVLVPDSICQSGSCVQPASCVGLPCATFLGFTMNESTGRCVQPAGTVNVSVQIHTSSWASEIRWNIDSGPMMRNHDDNRDHFTTVALSPGQHNFHAYDSFGDGWHGGWWEVQDDSNAVVLAGGQSEGQVAGDGETVTFTVHSEHHISPPPGAETPDMFNPRGWDSTCWWWDARCSDVCTPAWPALDSACAGEQPFVSATAAATISLTVRLGTPTIVLMMVHLYRTCVHLYRKCRKQNELSVSMFSNPMQAEQAEQTTLGTGCIGAAADLHTQILNGEQTWSGTAEVLGLSYIQAGAFTMLCVLWHVSQPLAFYAVAAQIDNWHDASWGRFDDAPGKWTVVEDSMTLAMLIYAVRQCLSVLSLLVAAGVCPEAFLLNPLAERPKVGRTEGCVRCVESIFFPHNVIARCLRSRWPVPCTSNSGLGKQQPDAGLDLPEQTSTGNTIDNRQHKSTFLSIRRACLRMLLAVVLILSYPVALTYACFEAVLRTIGLGSLIQNGPFAALSLCQIFGDVCGCLALLGSVIRPNLGLEGSQERLPGLITSLILPTVATLVLLFGAGALNILHATDTQANSLQRVARTVVGFALVALLCSIALLVSVDSVGFCFHDCGEHGDCIPGGCNCEPGWGMPDSGSPSAHVRFEDQCATLQPHFNRAAWPESIDGFTVQGATQSQLNGAYRRQRDSYLDCNGAPSFMRKLSADPHDNSGAVLFQPIGSRSWVIAMVSDVREFSCGSATSKSTVVQSGAGDCATDPAGFGCTAKWQERTAMTQGRERCSDICESNGCPSCASVALWHWHA
eukprot:COSAG06_NODE_150_length_22019_cov_17.221031_17_plen_928_part_00